MAKHNSTEEQLKATAEKLFFEKGYIEVSGRGICEAAGISRSRLHYYYTDKEHLAYAVMKQSLEKLHQELSSVIHTSCDTELKRNLEYMTVLIMCLISILSKNSAPSLFYSECMDAGIANNVLGEYIETSMRIINEKTAHPYDNRHIRAFSRMFANAFSANSKKYADDESVSGYMMFFCEVYSDLYMKMLDVDSAVRKEIIEAAEQEFSKLDIQFRSIYEIDITRR